MIPLADIGSFGWTDPISFAAGIVVGLGLSSSFQIVRKRDYDKLAREHEAAQLQRDHSHDRPEKC